MNISATPTASSATDTAARDTFAAHIVAALIVAPKQPGVPRLEGDALARQSYLMADAMMRARAA
jgi:hypothetical protein